MMDEKITLECTNCKAYFKLLPTVLGAQGKKVRCTKCQHIWLATPAMAILSKDAIIPDNEMNTVADFKKKQRFVYSAPLTSKNTFLSTMLLVLVTFGVLLFISIVGRHHIIAWTPDARILYQQMGIPIRNTVKGFTFSDLTYSKIMENGRPSLLIRGEIKNTTRSIKMTPLIGVGLYGGGVCPSPTWREKIFGHEFGSYETGHCVLVKWNVQMEEKQLLPGQGIPFETIHPLNPAWNIKNVFVDFISGKN